MAITTPRDVRRAVPVRLATATGLVLTSLLWSASVQAQAWRIAPALKATATATSNVGLQSSSNTSMDTVVTVTPQVQLQGTGPDYRLTGTLAADMVTYLGRSRADRILPRGQLVLNGRVVDRLLFVDAELGADTTSSTPFDLLSDGATAYNVGTSTRQRFSPYLDRELSPSSRLTARTDHVLTQGRGVGTLPNVANNADAYVQTHTARYDLRPEPAGLRAEFNRQHTQYNDSTAGGLMLQTARLSALYAPDPSLTLGLTGGRDAASFTTNQFNETLRGLSLRWAPTERTTLDALVEKRFFGNGWTVNFAHRSPFLAVSAGVVRQATTFASRLGVLQAGGDVATLVDSILQTRIQDAALRQVAVQDLIAKRGLPNTLTGPVDLFSRTVQLQQGGNVTLALIGVRHTVTLRLFQTRTEDLRGPTEDSVIGLASDATQRGATLGLSRRLTPETTADLTFTHTRTEGLGPNLGLQSNNSIVRLGATHSLSPRTTLSGAVRHQTGSSSLIGVNATESALSVGMLHRF
jgi:uncharacterized protein (PEP-CTERM system associated)